MSQQLLLLELNEVNFDYILKYCARGRLPNFHALLGGHAMIRTSSEQNFEMLEPWIQWVTAHTGLPFDGHSVFRLGDIIMHDLPQIWEVLEAHGLSVGALSPMNAKHRLRNPAFFVPDPWTATSITAPRSLELLYAAIRQAVNDNAQARLAPTAAVGLLLGLGAYARPANYLEYATYVLTARTNPWRKAILLDLLLADVFIKELRRTKPDFASLFLNGAAHIQHHYMFCSAAYDGPHRNPTWYVSSKADPLYEIYCAYDRLLGAIRSSFPAARLMLATGLHQVPHNELTYYWRLKDHAAFLRQIGLIFERCDARMSRDFLVTFAGHAAAAEGATRLSRCVAVDGTPLFEVDNRGADVFVTLSYSRQIDADFVFVLDGQTHRNLHRHVAFVALKNGKHHGSGYFVDTAIAPGSGPAEIPLSALPERIAEAFGVQFHAAAGRDASGGFPVAQAG